MKRFAPTLAIVLAAGCTKHQSPTAPSGPSLSFFVSSATSVTGNLGGLAGADATCQRLAAAVGQGSRTWRAYLSVERDAANGNQPTYARDRIGIGPWYNANLALVANTVAELHARTGDHGIERGRECRHRAHLRGLDVQLDEHRRAGRTLRRPGSEPEHRRHALLVECGARKPGLLQHRAPRRRRAHLLFRALSELSSGADRPPALRSRR